jgi:putative MATE family efflux protein
VRLFDPAQRLDLTSGSVVRPLAWLAVPVLLTSLLQTLYNLTDTLVVGQYDSTALAGLTFSFPIVFLFTALGSGVSITGRVLVAQYEGAGRPDASQFAAGQTLVFAIAVGVAVAVVGLPAVPPLLAAAGAEGAVLDGATAYLRLILAGLPLLLVAFVFSALLQGHGDAVTPFLVVLGSVVLNAILDPVLVFGLGPVPELGLRGAAFATLGARGVAAVAGVGILLTGTTGLRVTLADLRPDPTFLRRVVRVGVPASLETTTIAISVTAMLFVVGQFDESVVAGFGVGERVLSLMFLPSVGLATAATTMVGQNLGAGKRDRAHRAAQVSIAVALVGLTAVGLVVAVAAPAVARVFSPDPAVVAVAADFLLIVGPTFGAEAALRVYGGVFRGAGRTPLALAVTGTVFLPIRLGIALVLVEATAVGPRGIWLAYAASAILGAIGAAVVARVVDWARPIVDDRSSAG